VQTSPQETTRARTVHSACLLQAHVEDGLVARLETDNGEQPQYRTCAKCRAYRQSLYGPDRLQQPLRRTGPCGSGEFERVSWDAALDAVAFELGRVMPTHGRQAVLFLCFSGDIIWLDNPGLAERVLVRHGGYSSVWAQISAEGRWFAAMATYGTIQALEAGWYN